MKNGNVLFAIVSSIEIDTKGFFLKSLFSYNGAIDFEKAFKARSFTMGKAFEVFEGGKIGYFQKVEDIHKFCLILSQEIGCIQSNIINSEEYCKAMESCSTLDSLRQNLSKFGVIIKENQRKPFRKYLEKIF